MAALSTVAWSADTEVLLAGVQGGKRRATTAGQVRACSETRGSRSRDVGASKPGWPGGKTCPPGEEDCGLLGGCPSAFVVARVLFAACELGVFDLLAEAPEALGSAAVAARLGVSSRGTELLLVACVSLKLLQVEVRREKAAYENTELASTYLARASPKSQQDMLLYTARTTYLGWGHLAAAVRDRRNQYLKAIGVPSEELFTAIYRRHRSYLPTQHCLPIEEGRKARVALRIGMSPPCHVLCPLAGGSGALAKACMSLYPGSQVTVFDIPDVVQMAKRHFSFLEDERIGFCEGDFFKDCLLELDLCILARVLHDWTDEKCSHLLVRTYQACKVVGLGVAVLSTRGRPGHSEGSVEGLRCPSSLSDGQDENCRLYCPSGSSCRNGGC
ncbi:PREDICTED: acetylserotonin O-methyltransferase [Lipotes vexillifer]|uniref:Acetylserotonin O-methyltransferase n=1 Tax=Lipotes vexillifer TaxID=118797 RepID=A0A340XGK7_LIPVE|nr:PREDICTED: acetylserotonin O-methyltransferase [Lipotes vexillifer]